MKPIDLDGRTGEGGGQLVRLAVGLSALTTRPIKITNVRGNRPGARGGGTLVFFPIGRHCWHRSHNGQASKASMSQL
jgi:RNA 3'-terminal phosphate cyclase (ATP)